MQYLVIIYPVCVRCLRLISAAANGRSPHATSLPISPIHLIDHRATDRLVCPIRMKQTHSTAIHGSRFTISATLSFRFALCHNQHTPLAYVIASSVQPMRWARTAKTKYSIRLFLMWSITTTALDVVSATSAAVSAVVGVITMPPQRCPCRPLP
jgi:hypothetical protein